MSVEMVELSVKAPEPVRPSGVLQQNRVFLDFFWDLAKPDQEVRLKAVENLIAYLKTNNKVRRVEPGSRFFMELQIRNNPLTDFMV